MRRSSVLRTTGIVLIALGGVAAVGGLFVRDQISRHRRNLFSPQALKRLAALGYVSGMPATVDLVHLLRDFVAWEPNGILRRRGAQILQRMERSLEDEDPTRPAGVAG